MPRPKIPLYQLPPFVGGWRMLEALQRPKDCALMTAPGLRVTASAPSWPVHHWNIANFPLALNVRESDALYRGLVQGPSLGSAQPVPPKNTLAEPVSMRRSSCCGGVPTLTEAT